MRNEWWRHGVIYQVVVRSFRDTNGDGNGDLPGIIEKLEYLQWLGVDAIWLTPIHPSPWADGGYDVADFDAVHPAFGTMADMQRLIEEAHDRGLRVLLDYVPNHTSDQHAWFRESRSSRDNPRRDWYIWADPAQDGGPPNNWLSVFGGSAWTFDEQTSQYYFHAFLPEQPDLNWRNPAVCQAMCDVLRTWMARGIDGFRVDALDMLLEKAELTPNPENPDFNPESDAPDRAVIQEHTRDLPEVHSVCATFRRVTDAASEVVLLGEMHIALDALLAYYGTAERPELHLPLNLQLMWNDWDAKTVTRIVHDYLEKVPDHGWPAWSIGNHDRSRTASRVGPAQARAAAMLLLTVRGTPTLYYGDEIGMFDVPVPPDRTLDPQGQAFPERNRDPARSPMQWDGAPDRGFGSTSPYLPFPDDVNGMTVAEQTDDPHSMLTLHRRLLALRREHEELRIGSDQPVPEHEKIVAWIRATSSGRLLVAVNLTADEAALSLADVGAGNVLLSTWLDREGERIESELHLRPDEGVILRLS